MQFKLTKPRRLAIIIAISFSFFCAEISVGFYTHSLVLIADAFHYLNDLIGFIVALVASKISERTDSPKELSFGWQRANLLGAFFNGVFLLALGVSIFLQSIERFVAIEDIKNPKLVLIIGAVGFALNLVSASFLHEHDEDVRTIVNASDERAEATPAVNMHQNHYHESMPATETNKHEHDAGLMGVLLHVIGDAVNNIGVIIAASIMWKVHSPKRFYADPAISMAIALMILLSSWPLVYKTGMILLESIPTGVDPQDVRRDLEKISGVISVHELHIWRLNQQKSIASAHIVISEELLPKFMGLAKTISECFHAYGIHSATVQPELVPPSAYNTTPNDRGDADGGPTTIEDGNCFINCDSPACQDLGCCS